MRLRALVIEDEIQARMALVEALKESRTIKVVGEAESLTDARHLLRQLQVDVVFLGINIEEGHGLKLFRSSTLTGWHTPYVVLNAAIQKVKHPHEINCEIDVHTITPSNETLRQENEKQFRHSSVSETTLNMEAQVNSLLIRLAGWLVNHQEIVSVRTGAKGTGTTTIILENYELTCSLSLRKVLEQLPKSFCKVSRFEAINTNYISYIDLIGRRACLRGGHSVEIGEHYMDIFNELQLK